MNHLTYLLNLRVRNSWMPGAALVLVITTVMIAIGVARVASAQTATSQPANVGTEALRTPTNNKTQEYTGAPQQASVGGSEAHPILENAGLFSWGPISLIEPPVKNFEKWLSENARLDIGFRATFGFQQASGGPGERSAAEQDYRIYGTWHAFNWEPENKGSAGNFYFRTEYRDEMFTKIPPAFLANEIGTLFTTTYGFDQHDPALVQFYYEQFLMDGDLRLRFGKIDPDDYFNLGRWADDYRYFMNTLFSAFPGANHPSGGLGMNAQYSISPEWTVTAGFSDVQGRKTESGFETFFGDFDVFAAADITWSPTFDGLGKGNYRFGVEHRDASENKGSDRDNGFYINIDQEICKDVAPFLRFWHGEGDATGVETALSGGIAMENCFNRPGDAFGVGFGFDIPKDDDLGHDMEYAAEIFYRLQLTRTMQWSLGYQGIINPALDPNHDLVGVFETRLLIEF
jgi:hypothetical protein